VELPSQTTADGGLLVWCGGVPANGYQAFNLSTWKGKAADGLKVTKSELETPFWHIQLNDGGRIIRLYDKQVGCEVVPAGQLGNRLVVFEDKPLNYDAWDIDAFHAAKSIEVDALESVEVKESGPERAMLELNWRIGERSRVVQRMCIYARSPRIDFVTDVEWQERQALLKVAFPTDIRNRRATYEIQFGTIDRPTHRNTSWEEAAFEVPAQRWADLSDSHYGVAVLADCKHGYSVHESTLWLSLLKGAIDPDPDADRGQHHFTYSLLPHAAGLETVRRAAYGLTRPLLWRRETAHPGQLPTQFSLASVADPSVVVETAKWAEDDDGLIVRLYEAAGGSTSASLDLGAPANGVDQVDLLERNPRPLAAAENGSVSLDFRAREIKTVLVRLPSRG
jgi:alpha-mannosidase